MHDRLTMTLVMGLMKASPAEWMNLSQSSTEVSIKFPANALIGLDEAASTLESLGFVVPDRMALLEAAVGFVMSYGLSALSVRILELVGGENGPFDKRGEDQKEDSPDRKEDPQT